MIKINIPPEVAIGKVVAAVTHQVPPAWITSWVVKQHQPPDFTIKWIKTFITSARLALELGEINFSTGKPK